MISAHVNVAELLCCAVQENLTMVLELVYSDDERRIAQSTSKQIWDILYKDTVAPDVMQIEGGEDDIPNRENPLDNVRAQINKRLKETLRSRVSSVTI